MLRNFLATSQVEKPSRPNPPDARRFRAGAAAIVLCALLGGAITTAVSAQDARGILAPGNPVVTGFSGTKVAAPAPGADPADLTEIDLSGPSARIVDVQAPGAPPRAQVLTAPKPFTVTAAQVGQVFGVALDDAVPPNIFVAATSAYGLPIIAPGPNGGLVRARQGGPNATFMPGLFGPQNLNGGPGSIWRIDGQSGEVRLFANVTLDGLANSGAALGGLAFDPASHLLFVADRGTGMIHAFDPAGTERGRFDHGTQGRSAAGMPAVAFDPAGHLDITNPGFHTDDPATWGYAPNERRVFGLGVHAGRLYYAVAGEQVWSVSVAPGTSFGGDARLEIVAPLWEGESEISKITFDDQGGMLLAERAAPTGAYDFGALAREGVGRVLHYQQVAPAQADQQAPAQPGDQPVQQAANAPAPAGSWQPVPDEYAIGFPADLRNDNGGVAIGYSYGPDGTLDRGACGGFLWTTGEQLRVTADQALAAQLASGGPAIVNGLQGNEIAAVRPANVPPLQTYFVDYDDAFGDPQARGHLGDIAIWRICDQASAPAFPPPSLVVPVGFCQLSEIRLPGGECCERRYVRRGRCEAPPRFCPPHEIRLPNGECCDPREVRRGRCERCPPDTVRTPNGQCCDPRQVRDGRCDQCPPDTIRTRNGQCCDPRQVRDGVCQPPRCPTGEIMVNGKCCDRANVHDGQCVPPRCPSGEIMVNGKCCDRANVHDGQCVPPTPPRRVFHYCAPGETRLLNGNCITVPPVVMLPGRHHRVTHEPPPHRGIRHIAPRWQQHGTIARPVRGQQQFHQQFHPMGGGGRQVR